MKTKYIILTILCLTISSTSEAQLLKKIKRKAQQAAERTILNKTDEIVSGTTEKTIDDVSTGNENNAEDQNSVNTTNTTGQTNRTNSAYNPMGSTNVDTSQLPSSYDFDWEFKTEMVSSKGDKIQMNYLLNSDNKDYAGMQMSTEESRQQGDVLIVLDSKAKAMVMFMDANGQKMAQLSKLPEPKKTKDEEFTFKEIGTKTILGYECFGIEVENKGYKGTMYYTLDAPISFSAFFAFANSKNSPKGFDPALIEVLKDEALLMEMHAVNKKKSKESYTLSAISLDKKDNYIKKENYQFMKMGF